MDNIYYLYGTRKEWKAGRDRRPTLVANGTFGELADLIRQANAAGYINVEARTTHLPYGCDRRDGRGVAIGRSV